MRYKDEFPEHFKKEGYNIKIQSPYYDLYIKEYDEDLNKLIRDYTKTFLNNNQRVKNAIRNKDFHETVYWHDVIDATEKNAHKVEGIEARSIDYVLDHIIPISHAFKYGIDPEIIGSAENLQILTNLDNLRKSNKITDQVKDKLQHFNLSNLQEIKYHRYDINGREYTKVRGIYRDRIKEGLIIKYFTKEMELLQTELL